MWTWAKKNPLVVAIIAVLLFVALGSAVDSWRVRKLLKTQQIVLEDAAAAKEQELEDAEKAWLRVLNASGAKLAPILKERDALKKKLAAAAGAPFVPPETDAETLARWQALGYQVEVRPCR